MRVKFEVKGLSAALKAIASQSPKGQKRAAVKVGFSAFYSLWVHEDMAAKHPRGGQAKFLTGAVPAATHHMGQAVRATLTTGGSMADAVKAAGQELLAHAIPLTPEDTGYLKSSAYVRPVKA